MNIERSKCTDRGLPDRVPRQGAGMARIKRLFAVGVMASLVAVAVPAQAQAQAFAA